VNKGKSSQLFHNQETSPFFANQKIGEFEIGEYKTDELGIGVETLQVISFYYNIFLLK